MRGPRFVAASWSRRKARVLPILQQVRRIAPYLLVLGLLYFTLRRPYKALRRHVLEARQDSLVLAAQDAAQQLHLTPVSTLQECFGALWARTADSFSPPCQPVRDFLTRLAAAGLIMPLHGDGHEYNRTGVCAGGCFFAGNLRDAQLVMPNYIYQLAHVASTLSKHGNPVLVSVYESGSSDRTRRWLQVLGTVLDALSVPHELQVGGTIERQKGEERIHFLARVRSAALTPLYQQCAARGTFCPPKDQQHDGQHGAAPASSNSNSNSSTSSGRIVFLNDILFAAGDVLRLLQYPADLVCGLDLGMAAEPDLTWEEHHDTVAAYLVSRWRLPRALARRLSRMRLLRERWRAFHRKREPLLREFGPLFFYDKWVARDISGRMFANREPYVGYPPSVARVRSGRPVRVHCCWNGLAVIGAAPLVSRAVAFREHVEGECSASECSLLCDDMWRLGYGNMVMDPNVRVTYDLPGARRLFKDFTSDLPIGVPGVAYAPFRQADVREVLGLPLHDDRDRESGGGGGGPRVRQVDCCDLAKGADMVEFRDAGVCHLSNVTIS